MQFAVGSLIRARGREWVVLPDSTSDTLLARPLGGGEAETTGFYLPLEKVEPATFALPDPSQSGDAHSCRLLRDALRLGFRCSAGPFRSFARIAVEPRPYQLVPLLMALKLDPVRLLIADDVGVGKTIEAGLILRELIDRGEIRRFSVLCPPQVAEQWALRELGPKFHLDCALVLPGTVTKLERQCRLGQSIFDRFPYTVVSTDFIKSDRRRDDFIRTAPEFIIVDEAHMCSAPGGPSAQQGRSSRHQRHQIVKELVKGPKGTDRHLLLVTATPHSGNENAFRSLLGLLNPEFAKLPEDLSGPENEKLRRTIAAHLVQRRRGDIRHFLQTDTPFPVRKEDEQTYKLSTEYRSLFDQVLTFAEESVFDPSLEKRRQRIRWWSALALLRALASSPAAANATLRTRAIAENETPEELDEIGRRTVLDLEDETAETPDLALAGNPEEEEPAEGCAMTPTGERLMKFALLTDGLRNDQDPKLAKCLSLLRSLLKEGFHPILFCRFIPTAEYVAEYLRTKLKDYEIAAITSTLPPSEREQRIGQLGTSPKRILVCTDCLSEGINLQHAFNAVIHYDLSWNPTRHEQREGRVDRFGQPSPEVRSLTFYGEDNLIDQLVVNVLLRKSKAIKNSLGVAIAVPIDGEQLIQDRFKELLRKWRTIGPKQRILFEQDSSDDLEWKSAEDREKRSRTLFAQETIKADEVIHEIEAAREALGSSQDVARFVSAALRASGAAVDGTSPARISLKDAPRALCDRLGLGEEFSARFEPPLAAGEILLGRTHPAVEALAHHVLTAGLDALLQSPAKRCGVMRTLQVQRRTTLLLLRHRFHIVVKQEQQERQLLAEDAHLVAFEGAPQSAIWLDVGIAEKLPEAQPSGNVTLEQARSFLEKVTQGMAVLEPKLREFAKQRAELLRLAHTRVRHAGKAKQLTHTIEANELPDVLGIFVYLPSGN